MEAVINSSSRQTYNKIEDLLTNKKTKEEIGLPEVAYKSVIEAKNIANKLLEIRHERNALDFDLATMNLNLNQDCTNIKHIDSTERLFAHQLIEELMIAANKCAAGKIKTFSKNSWIFRTHKQPSNSKFENLVKTMLRFNIKPVQKKKNIISKITSIFNKSEVSNHAFALGSILEQAKQHEQKDLLQVLILQSMSPASYSNVEGEHFGLSLDLYTHFTSPIRRYADLMVHRILKEPKKYEKTEELESVCIQCSKMEKNAERATKSLEQIFICNFANQYIGKPTNGIISKMLPSSCLINLVEFKIYAEISKDELKKHNLQIDYKSNSIFNRKTKKYFGLGKKLKVSICDTDELKTKINLTIIKG
jgi:ribonuclease R